jgi:hypothetical protein
MQDLRVIGVENGALLVASDDGTRFRIPIDEVLQSKLRQNIPDPGTGRKIAPREIQAHIRSGMSAEDVAAVTGVSLEYIRRFEGPVLAEREFVVESALAVTVHTAADTDPMRQGTSFGAALRERLHDLGGSNERWASWKELDSGWIVKLSFTANHIEHDARWQFDPKKNTLAPLNSEAVTLSQQGDAVGPLIPRLRAVTPTEDDEQRSRFDSGAFALDTPDFVEILEQPAPVAIGSGRDEDDSIVLGNQTADLLEALRRRRGERETAHFDESDDAHSNQSSTGSVRILDVPLESFREEVESEDPVRTTQPQIGARRKNRASMPSWDEIVFGARSDDDPA